MMTRTSRYLARLGAVALIVALTGCGSPSTGSEPTPARPGDLAGVWTLAKQFDSPEQPYIAFSEDGTWSASDGCNRVRGTWKVGTGGTLTTTAGPQTMMACDGAQLPLAVARATHAAIDGDSLVIRSTVDSTTTTLVRSTDPRVGPQGLPIGYWVESTAPDAQYLSIRADHTYSGSDGCNTFVGTWESAGDETITLAAGATTLKACDNSSQWLQRAVTGRNRAGIMTLQAADGSVLGQLTGM
jgi:heat shock protein HslJ